MTPKEKQTFRFEIVSRELIINWAEDNFFSLPMYKILKLADYAEIFGIQGKNGMSPAMVLFHQLKKEWESFIY